MPPSIEPAPFYGNDRPSLDMIQKMRVSRLIATKSVDVTTTEEKRKSKSSHVKQRYSGVKLFPGLSHGIKKPKPKKLKLVKEKKAPQKSASVREKMRNMFDFSRTPYAIPARKRIALNDETSEKRKFFKSTLETVEDKRAVSDKNESVLDFGDMDDVDEEPFAEIREDVANTLHQIDWSDDEECLRPQITRQKAGILENSSSSPNVTYLTLTSMNASTISTTPTSQASSKHTNVNSEVNSVTPTSQTGSCITPLPSKVKSVRNNENVPENTPTPKKYFPLFTSPSKKNLLSDVTNKVKKSTNLLNRAAAPSDQYQIDAGQKVIGPRECQQCRMVYDIGDPFDKIRHDHYHNNRSELKYRSMTDKNVVGYCGTDRIVLIKHADAKKRQKIVDVLKITEEEIGKGYSFESPSVAYLYIRQDNILGCLIAEPNVEASRVLKSEGIILLSELRQRVKCGVNRIWVKGENRGQKIATELMNCMRKNFRLGEYLDLNDIAFSATTPDGDMFAKKYTKRDDYLTYLGANIK